MKYLEAWLAGVVGIFGLFCLTRWFITMCVENCDEWWGGLPLWATGAIGVLAPLTAGYIATILWLLK